MTEQKHLTSNQQYAMGIGYTLFRQGYDALRDDESMLVVRQRALEAIARDNIVFADLAERGDFFQAIGEGQQAARQEIIDSHCDCDACRVKLYHHCTHI